MSSNSKRLYRRVADQIAEAIKKGEYAVGEKLPGERELAESFGVSRPSVREAMIALEIYGIVEIRHGVGNIVVETTGRIVTQDQDDEREDLNVGPFELLEARIVIEGGTSAIAAAVATDEDIAELEALLKRMDTLDHDEAEAADREFHLKIASITNNGPLADYVEMLWELRYRSMLSAAIERRAGDGGRIDRHLEHESIINALRNRDPLAARQAMQTHLERVRDFLLQATEAEEMETLLEKQRNARRKLSKRIIY